MKKLILCFVCLVFLMLFCSCETTYQGYSYYNNNTDGVTISGYNGDSKNLVIPSVINGKTVTEIGQSAFDESEAESIVIPDGVQRILDYAFRRNSKLQSIEFPDSVRVIGKGAFNFCSSLTSVKFGENITEIGSNSFAVTYIDEVIMPNSAKYIGEYAFYDCKLLKKAEIPGAEVIKNNAFSGCISLSEITLGNNLSILGDYCFANCLSLNSIDLGKNISELPMGVFSGTGFTEYRVPNSIKTIGRNAFEGCSELVDIYIPASVDTIDDTALPQSRNLTVHGKRDSQGEIYADYHGLKFEEQ